MESYESEAKVVPFQSHSNVEVGKPHAACNTPDGRFTVKVRRDGSLFLFSGSGRMSYLKAEILEKVIPRFKAFVPAVLSVSYEDANTVLYHFYKGGKGWRATVPNDIAVPGDVLQLCVHLLSEGEFVRNLPKLSLMNPSFKDWLSSKVELGSVSIVSNKLELNFNQIPPLEGVTNFSIVGSAHESLGFNSGRTTLDFEVNDLFGQTRVIRMNHDGHKAMWLGVKYGDKFERILFVSSDGMRTRFVKNAGGGEVDVLTKYLREPSDFYQSSGLEEIENQFHAAGAFRVFQVNEVRLERQLESEMLRRGSNYELGRLGAEIAYTIARKDLGLGDIVLVEPSKEGRDLFTRDGKVVIQTRFVRDWERLSPSRIDDTVRRQVLSVLFKLRQDFAYNPHSNLGYGVFSYAVGSIVKSIVVASRRANSKESVEY